MRFTKMEGLGNDYIYITGVEERVKDPVGLAVRMSRYHFGCYSDGLILILPSDVADFKMRMFNNDGSEAGMCGNGVRCIAKYVHDRGLTDKTTITLETLSGVKTLVCHLGEDGAVETVTVDMGEPVLNARQVPVLLDGEAITDYPLDVEGEIWPVTLVSVGNPHAISFVDMPQTAPVTTIGPKIENHPLFPERVNAEFATAIDRGHISMRVWERGSGETLACGTGACAVMVAAVLTGRVDREADVALMGGTLHIRWDENDNHVYMTGPAKFVYDGVWLGE